MNFFKVNNKIYYYEVSITPNVEIIGIGVSTQKKKRFEIIFTYYYDMNIKDSIGKIFGSRERFLYMLVNAYFGPIKINIPHAAPNYELWKSKFYIDYYR